MPDKENIGKKDAASKDSIVALKLDEKQLEKIQRSKKEREAREAEEERVQNLKALEEFQEKQKREEEKKKKKEKEEELKITPVVKTLSFTFLLIATIIGWIASVAMIAAEVYIVMHFKLHFCCWIVIVLQCLAIVFGTIARWLNWFIKTRKVVEE